MKVTIPSTEGKDFFKTYSTNTCQAPSMFLGPVLSTMNTAVNKTDRKACTRGTYGKGKQISKLYRVTGDKYYNELK